MRKVSSNDTLIVKLARTVGNAAGRMAAATHDLAENAAAAVRSSGSSSNQREHSVSPARNKRARIAQRTPKKVSRSSARARSKPKKSAVTKKAARARAHKSPRASAR